ncbi:hypothetical protein AB4142_34820, partial [Variovorax sp. 2RAF20]
FSLILANVRREGLPEVRISGCEPSVRRVSRRRCFRTEDGQEAEQLGMPEVIFHQPKDRLEETVGKSTAFELAGS